MTSIPGQLEVRDADSGSSASPRIPKLDFDSKRTGNRRSNSYEGFLQRSSSDLEKIAMESADFERVKQVLTGLAGKREVVAKSDMLNALESNLPRKGRDELMSKIHRALSRIEHDVHVGEFLASIAVADGGPNSYPLLLFKGLCVFVYFALAPLVFSTQATEQWTVWDSLYFAVVTFTTVGYGDFSPVQRGESFMVFSIFYILFGLLVIASVVDDALNRLLASYEAGLKSVAEDVEQRTAQSWQLQTADLGISTRVSKSLSTVKFLERLDPMWQKVLQRLLTALGLFFLPILVGTCFFALNEGWPWLHALYHSVVTCTTIGYGDLSLERQSSRIFSIFFIILGVASVGSAFGILGTLRLEVAMEHRQRQLLHRAEHDVDMLTDLDKDGNGVDRCEFVCAMLVQLGKVSEKELRPLFEKFDELDADGSGMLTHTDLMALKRSKS